MPHEAPSPHLFCCNGGKLSSRKKIWKSADAHELSTSKGGSVGIKIRDIYKQLESNISDRAADLMEIAACVYVADQLAKRTGRKTVDYGDLWYRHFRFEVGVRDLDFWNDATINDSLVEMLSFLSGDNFEFSFVKNPSPAPLGEYLNFRATDPNPEGIDRVVMFSGGLDSLGGAVHSIFEKQEKVALVSHTSVGHIKGIQNTLVEQIQKKASGATSAPTHVPVWANKHGLVEVETTQRSRSFLYVALGAVVANLYGLSAVDFYENGIVSVNLPLAQHSIGGRATRTTHPQTMRRFQHLLSQVFDKDMAVRNEFFDHTKQDVVELIERAGHGDLIDQSISCTHTRGAANASPHCGLCSQCLSRRFATLGVKNGHLDSASRYRADVLTAPRTKTENRILAERFLGQAQQIERMHQPHELQRAFTTEMARITPYLEGKPSEAMARLFELHRRHAGQVGEVIRDAMRANVDALHAGTLPESCPVALAFKQSSGAPCISDFENSEPSKPTKFVDRFKPSRDQLLIMQIIAESKTLLIQTELESATRKYKHPISRKTIGLILQALEKQGLVDYPQGRNKGPDLTEAGRQMVADAASQ